MSTADINDLNNFYWFFAINFGICFCFIGFYFLFHCVGLLDKRKILPNIAIISAEETKENINNKKVNRIIFTLDWFLFIDLILALLLLFFIVLYAVELQAHYSNNRVFTILSDFPLTFLPFIRLILTIISYSSLAMSSFFGFSSIALFIDLIYLKVHNQLKNAITTFFNALLWIYR